MSPIYAGHERTAAVQNVHAGAGREFEDGCHPRSSRTLLEPMNFGEAFRDNWSFCDASEEVGIYEIKRGNFSVKITNYGAIVISVILPDKNGKLGDVVLGFDSVDDYKNDTAYFGAIVGRVANRIGGASFKLNGVEYRLPANDHGNTLHGGFRGFSDVIWTVEDYKKDSHLTLSYNSYDGEQGFPGDLSVSVTYMFIGKNKLGIRMKAKALNKATPVNLASHSYWNLGGHDSGDILSHTIQLFGSKITPVDEKLIPTGAIAAVKGTAYDFLQPRAIGSELNELPGGYDINYVLDSHGSKHLGKAAVVVDSKSGRKMELWTNKPGVQFYTSNMLTDTKGKGGYVYKKHAALCLETQGFPDSVNHPNFPSQIVNPGETYDHVMVYRFTTHDASHTG
nr:aldose 1-epimerase-like [Ipomoea trifida]